MARLCMCHIVQIDTVVIAMSNLSDCGVNTLNAPEARQYHLNGSA